MFLEKVIENFDEQFMEKKSWGWKYNFYSDHYMAVDVCFAQKGGFCSWHEHDHQFNAFLVLFGRLLVTREYSPSSNQKVEIYLGPNEKSRKTMVFPMHRHQFEALEPTIFVEMGTVKYSREDIIRYTEGGIK